MAETRESLNSNADLHVVSAGPAMTQPKGKLAVQTGAKTYLVASVVAPIAALLRNVVIARMLGPEMFGLAVTLIVTGQFFEMLTNFGGDQFLVQDSKGDAPRVQAMAQLTMVIRGLMSSALTVAAAIPLAQFYDEPELTFPLVLMALIPLCGSFTHLDLRRYQRQHKFGPESWTIIVSELGSLIVAVAFAIWFKNYYAVFCSLLARALISVVMSHLVAERPYRLGYDAASLKRLTRFGWPLLLNGGVLFFGTQGDRILIGRLLGATELGLYSTSLLLIFYPMAMVQRFLSNIHLPRLIHVRDIPDEMAKAEKQLKSQLLLVGCASAIAFAAIAPVALLALYGPQFVQEPTVLALVGVLQAFRLIRTWPATMSLATGNTVVILISNIIRLAALPAAYLAYLHGYGILGIVSGLIIGEVISILSCLSPFSHSRADFFRKVVIMMGVFSALTLSAISLASSFYARGSHFHLVWLVTSIIVLALLLRTDSPILETCRNLLKVGYRRTGNKELLVPVER